MSEIKIVVNFRLKGVPLNRIVVSHMSHHVVDFQLVGPKSVLIDGMDFCLLLYYIY